MSAAPDPAEVFQAFPPGFHPDDQDLVRIALRVADCRAGSVAVPDHYDWMTDERDGFECLRQVAETLERDFERNVADSDQPIERSWYDDQVTVPLGHATQFVLGLAKPRD